MLPVRYKWLVLETWLESLGVAIVLRTPWWRRLLDQSRPPKHRSAAEDVQVEAIAILANKAMSVHLRRMTCLDRAITLQTILRRRGIWAPLVFGVQKEQNGNIAAHAWLDHPALPDNSQGFLELENYNFPIV